MIGVLILLGIVVGLALPLWAIIDAARRPSESFWRIGSDKSRWIVLLVLLTVLVNLAGVVASIVYLTSTRTRLRALADDPTPMTGDPPAPADQQDQLVSDAEREGVTRQLQQGYETGRLTFEELHARLDRALRARTIGELTAVVRDLPPA